MDSFFFCFVAGIVGMDTSVSSLKKRARKSFSKLAQFLMESARSFINHSKGNPLKGVDEQTSHNSVIWYYVTSLGLEVVYVLVQGIFAVKGLQGRRFELGRIVSNIPLDWVWTGYSRLLKIASTSNGFQVFFKFVHPLGVMASIFWASFLFRWRLGGSKLELSLLSLFSKVEISPSFCFPLLLLEEAPGLEPFDFFFEFVNKRVIICLRSSIVFCRAQNISCCSVCTKAWSSNLLAISSGVLAMYAKASFFI